MSEPTDSPYMTTAELALYIRKSPVTIRKMRQRGDGPKGTRVGRSVLYRRTDVAAWLRDRGLADELHQRAA
ncbi:helix-turn-helix transcriptional regulator [Streptomyces xiamenensis]|uniref:helix-turn-helix transcriptional regulator n=1 Tax=Streptomyces xiamenensis TaxID=408015 RepID=UPI0037D37C84